MMIYGGLFVLIAASLGVMVMAAVGVYRLRQLHASATEIDVHCRRLERDLVIAVGMTMAVWAATGVALLVNPSLGATPLEAGGRAYSVARGTIMLAFGHCFGWGGFLVLRAQWWESPRRMEHL